MKKFITIFLIVLAYNCNASSIWCTGKLENIYVDDKANVFIKGTWRGDWTKICSANTDTPMNCSMWMSQATTAVKNNLSVTVQYRNAESMTCGTIPKYSDAPAPVYIMVHNPDYM